MGLFRASAPASVRVSDNGSPLRVSAAATGKPWSLWADGLGTFAIRALQILLAVLLIGAVMAGIGQLTVVVIPLLLALILASAFAPVMRWLRRKGVPSLAATLLTLLTIVLLLTWYGAKAMRLDRANAIVLLFCGSKKSLASGVPIAGVLFPTAQVGMAILPLMLFHQIQLIACAVIARRLEEGRAD